MFRVLVWLTCVLVLMIEAASAQFGADNDADEVDAAVAIADQFVLSEQQFDQMVFGGSRSVTIRKGQRIETLRGGDEHEVRKRWDLSLANEIQAVDRACSLADAQKKKLQLAGQGDITHWFSRVRELRQKYTGMVMSRQEYSQLMMELQPFRFGTATSLIGERSLFRKALHRTLDQKQCQQIQALEQTRKTAAIEGALLTWERNANGIKLDMETRREFINTLIKHGRVPQSVHRCQYQYYVVFLEAGRIQEHLKPLLSESQWEALQLQVTNARRVEPTLRVSGVWPVEDEDESPTKTSKK